MCVALQKGSLDPWATMMRLVTPHLKGDSRQRLMDRVLPPVDLLHTLRVDQVSERLLESIRPQVDWLHALWVDQVSAEALPAAPPQRPFDSHCMERARRLRPVVQLSMAVHAVAFKEALGF